MKISCGLVPGPEAADLAVAAEGLGYERVFVFDSAPLWEDTFVHLALIAERTRKIGLGTAVLIPTQRHVMTMASAIATIARLAPDRLVCCFGTGFTARRCLGQPPMKLADFMTYLKQLRALLAGETVTVDGKPARMMHWKGLALDRPINVPLWISAFGPKGQELARDFADGLIGMAEGHGSSVAGLPLANFISGTVLDAGEEPKDPRPVAAVGPWRVSRYHMAYERGPELADKLPGGAQWRTQLEAEGPVEEAHLRVHEGHVTHIAPRDEQLIPHMNFKGLIGSAAQIRDEVQAMANQGFSEVIYSPAGPDQQRELETFKRVVEG